MLFIEALTALCFVFVLITQDEGAPHARATRDSLQFMVLADWGGADYHPYTTQSQIDVAKQMALTAEQGNLSFVLALGDNFYMAGVDSSLNSRFETTFEQVYHQESLQIPWYVIAGNHDHYQSVRAQIRRSEISFRWNFPHFYYTRSWTLPGNKEMEIILLDTTLLCGQTRQTSEGKRVFGPNNVNAANLQWSWLENNLKASRADYLLVGGHYPVYSVGENGPTECLYSRLEPILYENRVTAYFSGHDHNFQHIQTQRGDQKMDYFVTGGVAWPNDNQTNIHAVPTSSLKFFFGNTGGFALVDVTTKRMKLSYITSNGDVEYSYKLHPRK